MLFTNITISGAGTALPDTIRTNKEIEFAANTTEEWIQSKLGIYERRSAEKETVSDLGTRAALAALKNAKVDKEEIDLIVVATSSPEKISPATACTIHKKLGIKKDIPAFDINAVCAGFVFGMTVCAPFIDKGLYKNILLIATETYSKITDWNHRNCVFFGDGAAAVVLSTSEKGWIFANIKSNGSDTGSTGFFCPLDGKYITEPKEVWDQAVKVLPISITDTLKQCNIDMSEISLFIPHQASINMLKLIASKVGLPENKLKTIMHKYGNVAGASIPIALSEALENNEIKKGDKILLTAIGSGWSWGSIVLNYE